MAENYKDIEELVKKDEKLIDLWGRRNPRCEKRYEQSVIRVISDYGVGASVNTGAKGKILGAGYEPYIMSFFIGLYANKRINSLFKKEGKGPLWLAEDKKHGFGVCISSEYSESSHKSMFLLLTCQSVSNHTSTFI